MTFNIFSLILINSFILPALSLNSTTTSKYSVGYSELESKCPPIGEIQNGGKIPSSSGSSLRIHFYCHVGYRLVGTNKMVCSRQFVWEPQTPPYCERIVCPTPSLLHGRIDLSRSQHYVDSHLSVTCDEGYSMQYEKWVCQQDGQWWAVQSRGNLIQLTEKELDCQEQTCPTLDLLSNGSLEIEGMKGADGGYRHGSIATYKCNIGFALSPYTSRVRKCRDGRWIGQQPVCERSGCNIPEKIQNGYFENLDMDQGSGDIRLYTIGSKVKYYCNSHYIMIGAETYQCMADGNWSPPIGPICQPLEAPSTCASPEIPHTQFSVVQGYQTSSGYRHTTVLEFVCEVGYRDQRQPCVSVTLECQRGHWIGSMPKCRPFTYCEKPPSILNGQVYESSSTYTVHSKVYYSCNSGYSLIGPSTLKCEVNGCWTSTALPLCRLQSEVIDTSVQTKSTEELLAMNALMICLVTGGSVLGILLIILLVVAFHRRCFPRPRRLRPRPPTWVPRSPVPSQNAPASLQNDPDRVALIAFADGVQVLLPSYEEAVRQNPPPYDAHLSLPTPSPGLTGSSRGSRHHRQHVSSLRRPRRERDNMDSISYHSVHIGPTRQSSSSTSHSASLRSASAADSMGSTDTMTPSEVSTTITLETVSSGTSSSTTPSCRAICGSLASFDTSSILNTEGVPLLEESELEGSLDCGTDDVVDMIDDSLSK